MGFKTQLLDAVHGALFSSRMNGINKQNQSEFGTEDVLTQTQAIISNVIYFEMKFVHNISLRSQDY